MTCDNTTQGGRKKKKIPTAAPKPSFLTKFLAVHHLSVFSAEDTTGEEEKTTAEINAFLRLVQTAVPDIHFSKWAEALNKRCKVSQGRFSPLPINKPLLPFLTCNLRCCVIHISSGHISLLLRPTTVFPPLLKCCNGLAVAAEQPRAMGTLQSGVLGRSQGAIPAN